MIKSKTHYYIQLAVVWSHIGADQQSTVLYVDGQSAIAYAKV